MSETLSSLLGYISIACWIVVYSPQIIENYRLQSGEGISIGFVIIWLLGDLFSLGGALLARLIPTIIILALYYSICDVVLLFQIYYYRWKGTARFERSDPARVAGLSERTNEEAPLLPPEHAHEVENKPSPALQTCAKYGAALLIVYASGAAAWWVSTRINTGKPSTKPGEVLEWRSQVMGWISAVLYLGARLPQISEFIHCMSTSKLSNDAPGKNFVTKCEGLSPGLFMFSISGNTTYALSIIAASVEPRYLIANASWLAGSGLTVFLDVFVLGQFYYYRSTEQASVRAET
ncbi:PQ-loop-domain-containing protein [Punctularia strigosozonata HHB-11173 SS5]|uniref:PQ-loop-domain-containing protein n=1 Tax=Punctularia strigosozonata (strain HHB-11173) TaxID=741275 RepID=UPI00044172F9|nr:PQ-loop-domain-containing protein [Punctularia strigosozonata HHB-11173 SS5]EIN12730.1 PQ-loop-domain-containing protein [Punctularia strigosozonata HHB-11173 SS5]